MDNQKRNILVVLISLIVIMVVGIVSRPLFIKKAQAPVVQPVVVQPVAPEPEPETPVVQNLYDNMEEAFEIKLPDNWKTVSQSSETNLSKILFYAGENADAVSSSTDPLLTLISNKIPYVSLTLNKGDFVAENFDIKSYVISGAGGPNRGSYADKLLSWDEKVTNNNQKFYEYTKEIQGQSVTQKVGVVWISGGKLFELSSDNPSQKTIIENMALSFISIS